MRTSLKPSYGLAKLYRLCYTHRKVYGYVVFCRFVVENAIFVHKFLAYEEDNTACSDSSNFFLHLQKRMQNLLASVKIFWFGTILFIFLKFDG